MNISESKKKVLNESNIYEACNGDYHESRLVNRRYIVQNETPHKLIPKQGGLKLVIDKNAKDLDKVLRARGRTIPPDEILDMMKPGKLKIPIADPKNSSGNKLLPSSELLKCIHYFVAKKYTKDMRTKSDRNKFLECMDETALLSMGIMLESWVDEFVTKDTCRMFLQRDESQSDGDIENDATSTDESPRGSSSEDDFVRASDREGSDDNQGEK
ncbi:hypothetical protein CANMA_003031 [Candida margitis]|uniref:uncharacterized protein n=1 Tax=Candida margitis TaxID=1775924 RepID=UPI0022280977|nr:uncharacterized protein CANMA_003031 [Candida margitis]KAI5967485.1 hypothetical protein CANMA_003031 [Candida margitis]